MTGAVLATAEYGAPAGRPLVALHGALGTKERFARIGTEGIPERRWLCLDLRGYGDSVEEPPWTIEQLAEDVVATLDSFGVEQADLFGTSLGGAVAFAVARLAPGRVRSIVAADAAVSTAEEYRGRRQLVFIYEAETFEELVGGSLAGRPPDTERWTRRESLAAVEPIPSGGFRRRVVPEAAAALRESMAGHLPPTLGPFAGRVLLLKAGLTTFVTEAGLAALRAELGARLHTVVFPDAGHNLLWDAYDETVAAIARFLDEHE